MKKYDVIIVNMTS